MDAAGSFPYVRPSLSREQIKGVVEAYLTIEDRRAKLSALVSSLDQSLGHVRSLLQAAREELGPPLAELRKTCALCAAMSAATQWAAELSPVGPVVAAGLGAVLLGSDVRSPEHLQRVCGLHPAAQLFTLVEANRLYLRIHQNTPEIPYSAAVALASNTGRSMRPRWRQDSSIPKDEIVDWLAKPPYSEFLHTLMMKAGNAFTQQKATFDNRFSRAFRERLLVEKRINETGGYETRARQEIKKAKPEEMADHQRGRLPQRRLEEMARNWMLRQFLAEFYKRLKSANGLGSEPVEEP